MLSINTSACASGNACSAPGNWFSSVATTRGGHQSWPLELRLRCDQPQQPGLITPAQLRQACLLGFAQATEITLSQTKLQRPFGITANAPRSGNSRLKRRGPWPAAPGPAGPATPRTIPRSSRTAGPAAGKVVVQRAGRQPDMRGQFAHADLAKAFFGKQRHGLFTSLFEIGTTHRGIDRGMAPGPQ